MNKQHPPLPVTHSLASSESTLGQPDKVDMTPTSVKHAAHLDQEESKVTRLEVLSEPDDAGPDHDEGTDSHVHSEDENDGNQLPVDLV